MLFGTPAGQPLPQLKSDSVGNTGTVCSSQLVMDKIVPTAAQGADLQLKAPAEQAQHSYI